MTQPIAVGAVLYDPKVAVIWEIIADFFEEHGCPIRTAFYSNYELQVAALLEGDLDIAWNSPLAWLDAQRRSGGRCRAVAMRDTDRDRVSHIVVRRDGDSTGSFQESAVRRLEDLRGREIAVGAQDSPQATLIPLGLIQQAGLEPGRDITVRRHDVLVGKHGDHIGGELEAFRALERGDVAACALLDLNWQSWSRDGTLDPSRYEILATTEPFDHCVFAVRADLPAELEQGWLKVLFSMSYENPAHREMMDLEGLTAWVPGRTTGFDALAEAVERQRFFAEGKG